MRELDWIEPHDSWGTPVLASLGSVIGRILGPMEVEQPTIPGLEEPQPEDGPLVLAARASIKARREHGAIMPWHETLCAAVIELAQQAQRAKGIAKAQLYAQMLAAEAKLPEPVIQESGDVVDYELDRIRDYIEQLGEISDPAHVSDPTQPAPVH